MAVKQSIIFHIDVNSAFLSWEAVHRLKNGDTVDLRTIPSVVGGDEEARRGIVLARSTPAKALGIKTGEALFMARKKCPDLVVVPPSHGLYEECSREMYSLLQQYSPIVERFSIDECFLDFTGMEGIFGDPLHAAYALKDRLRTELGFTVNIGLSENRLLAKMAGEFSKPDKVHTLWPQEIPTKLWPLPVGELYMVGRATGEKLNQMGIRTIGDLAACDAIRLERQLKSFGRLILNYANGIEEPKILGEDPVSKGIGNSTTTPEDVRDLVTACRYLLSLTESVAFRLREEKSCCGIVMVSLKDADFRTYSHQRKLEAPTDSTRKIYETAKALFQEMWKGEPLRLLGVRASDLTPDTGGQMRLFAPPREEKLKSLDAAIDNIRKKVGREAIVRASLLSKDE